MGHEKYRRLYKKSIQVRLEREGVAKSGYGLSLLVNEPSYLYCFHLSKSKGVEKMAHSGFYQHNFLSKYKKLFFSNYESGKGTGFLKGDKVICFASYNNLFFKMSSLLRSNKQIVNALDEEGLIDAFKHINDEIISYNILTF